MRKLHAYLGSSGKSVGNWRVSALGSSEEAVKLAAGGVEGALLVFPALRRSPELTHPCSPKVTQAF